MDLQTFQQLPAPEVAQIVTSAGTKVCVFPTNGTRRWLFLEHPPTSPQEFANSYLEKSLLPHIELYRLVFDHGISVLLSPIFGPDLMERGEEYMKYISEGLSWLATHPDFLAFYDEHEVRVRFYGDYRKYLAPTSYRYLCEQFDAVTERTAHNKRHCLFFGLFAHDPTETLIDLALKYYAQHGTAPEKRQLIAAYYGEYVPPVNLYIGFDKPAIFDVPLILTGSEDLYFTVSPSMYMTEAQLRNILFDHLYQRHDSEPDYFTMPEEGWAEMRHFYHSNKGNTLGIGNKHPRWGYWYPLPQVDLSEPEPDSYRQP